jgi:ketosteroid isomerase-like protein
MMDNDPKEVAAVEELVHRVWERFLAQDPEGMLALLHPDCTVWDIFQPQLVRAKTMRDYVAADYEQSAARGKLTQTWGEFTTDVWDDTANVRFYAQFSYEPPNALALEGRISVILRRFPDRGWLVVHVHEGVLPTGIPEITE